MSKVLVIPDIHLKPIMFERAAKILESGQADFAVQLGDIFDDWGQEFNYKLYDMTAEKAIEFHKKFPKTLWCMGNHDFGYYLPEYGRQETGHSRMQEDTMADNIAEMVGAGISQKTIHVVDNVIFSHAGLIADWIAALTLDGADYEMGDYIEVLINNAEPDLLWDQKSPIWARPQDGHWVMYGKKQYMQVVGHTPVKTASYNKYTKILSTDTFSTYSDGSKLGDRRFVIVDTVEKTWEYAKEEDDQ